MNTRCLTRPGLLAGPSICVILSRPGSIRPALAQDEGAFREQIQASRETGIGLPEDVRRVRGDVGPARTDTWAGAGLPGPR